MRRFHLFEFNEVPWFPTAWRRLFQLAMGQSLARMNVFAELERPFQALVRRVGPRTALDLCSGSGDLPVALWLRLTAELDPDVRPKLFLSDLFPALDSYRRLAAAHPETVDYVAAPVDAADPGEGLPRMRVVFNALHHFRPAEAQRILASAARDADGFAAFEITRRTWANMAQSLFVVPFIAVLWSAFLVRPFRWTNLLWGLLVPVVPLTTVFDGLVSNLRTYTLGELRQMTATTGDAFAWDVGTVAVPGTPGLRATYVFGWRKAAHAATAAATPAPPNAEA